MYSEADFSLNKRMRGEALTRMALCALPGLIFAISGAAMRIEPLCMAGLILCLGVLIFLGDLKLLPVLRYGRFLREATTGLSHRTAGTLVRIGTDPVYTDGVWFYELILNEYEDMSEEGERRFLLDCAKDAPRALLGRDVALTSHGNFVLDVEAMGDGHAAEA